METVPAGSELEWELFWEFWNLAPYAGGMAHYTYDDSGPDMYELEAGNIDNRPHMFEYCITFKGVRIYRAKFGGLWCYLYTLDGVGRFKGRKFTQYHTGLGRTVERILEGLSQPPGE